MANCKHGNDIDQCGFCRVERHKQVYGNSSGDVEISTKGRRMDNPEMRKYNSDIERRQEEAIRQEEIMKEYVLRSFTTRYKEDEEKSE